MVAHQDTTPGIKRSFMAWDKLLWTLHLSTIKNVTPCKQQPLVPQLFRSFITWDKLFPMVAAPSKQQNTSR